MSSLQKLLIAGALLGLSTAQERTFPIMGARSCWTSDAPRIPSDPSRQEKLYSASSQLSAFCDSPAELNLNAGPTDTIFKKSFEQLTFDIVRYPPDSTTGAALNISKTVCENGFGNVLALCSWENQLPSGFIFALQHDMEFRVYSTDYVPAEVVERNNWKPAVPAPPPPPPPTPPTPTGIVRPPIPTGYAMNCFSDYTGPRDFVDQNSQERQSINTTISNYCETMEGQVQIGEKNTFLRWLSAIGWVYQLRLFDNAPPPGKELCAAAFNHILNRCIGSESYPTAAGLAMTGDYEFQVYRVELMKNGDAPQGMGID